MNADTIRAQQDSFKRWRDKTSENPLRGATELPYIKPGRTFFRHRETFRRPNIRRESNMVICECNQPMKFIVNEFYCEHCHSSVSAKEIA